MERTQSSRFIKAADIAWESPEAGVTRQIMGYDGQLMLVRVHFDSGIKSTPHTHFHSQVTYVVSGKFKVTCEGESATLEAGDSFYIAPDEYHWAECIDEGLLIDAFTPHRADFLKK